MGWQLQVPCAMCIDARVLRYGQNWCSFYLPRLGNGDFGRHCLQRYSSCRHAKEACAVMQFCVPCMCFCWRGVVAAPCRAGHLVAEQHSCNLHQVIHQSVPVSIQRLG